VSRLAFFLVLFIARGADQNCIKYGAPTTLSGTLSLKDEAGYNEFIVLRLSSAICTLADPKDGEDATDPYYRKQSNISEVQASVYGNDAATNATRERVEKLIGYRAVIKGDLFPAVTGYDRTNVVLRVEAVDAADSSGQKAILKRKPEVKLKDVDVYDVTVNAGKRLVIEVYERGATAPLLPADEYLTHWMTGAGVVYFDCREGYKLGLLSTTDSDGGTCLNGFPLCGLTAFPKTPVMMKLRCTRREGIKK
jgi:hypothetical protein